MVIGQGRDISESLREENDLQAAKDTGNEHACFLRAWLSSGVQPDPYPGLDFSGDGQTNLWPKAPPQDETHNESHLGDTFGSKLAGLGRQVLNTVGKKSSTGSTSRIPNLGGLPPPPLAPRPLILPR